MRVEDSSRVGGQTRTFLWLTRNNEEENRRSDPLTLKAEMHLSPLLGDCGPNSAGECLSSSPLMSNVPHVMAHL